MKNRIINAIFILAISALISSRAAGVGLKSGPMPAYSTMAEVLIWLQTDGPGEVKIRYWPVGHEENAVFSDPLRTEKNTAYVAKCVADRVKASTRYEYEIFIDGQRVTPQFRNGYKKSGPIPLQFQSQPRWRHTKEYQPPDFRLATGSGAYLNEEGYNWEESAEPYGGGVEIFESIYEKSPDLMIWLGDSIYLREPDWTSRTGIHHRYNHFRSFPTIRALFAGAHHFAIWDDHDFGPNNSGSEFWNKGETFKAFQLYWGNPSYGLPETPGAFTFFNWADVNFYLLDNRSYRTTDKNHPEPFGRPRQYLGKAQVDWLVDSLNYSQNQKGFSYPLNFNIICIGGQVISDSSNQENYRNYSTEWQYLIDQIMHSGIDGVVFLTGDVHISEFSKEIHLGGGQPGHPGKAGKAGLPYVFHDLTVSPFTSGVSNRQTSNTHRMDIFPDHDIDIIKQRNFATLDFTGPKEDRSMTIRFWNTQGALINGKSGHRGDEVSERWVIRANDLKAPR